MRKGHTEICLDLVWSVKATIYCGLASFIGSYRETTESAYHSLVLLWSFFSFKGRILIGWQTINYKVGLASHQRLLQCVSLSPVNIWWKHKMRSFLSQQLQWLVKVQRNTPPQPSSVSLVVECVFAFYCLEILEDTHWNLSLAEESFHWRQTLKANVQSVGFICICITLLKMLSSTSVAISFLCVSLSVKRT